MTAPLLSLDRVGKDYAKVETRGGQLRLVFDLLRGAGAAHVFRALDDVSFALQPRRIARRHRRERRGQVDAAQDRRRRGAADARQLAGERPRRRAARARLRLPPRVHRAREHRPRRSAARPRARTRSPPSATRSSRSPTSASTSTSRSSTTRRAWSCASDSRWRPRCARHAHHRRGARGRRRVVPEEVHRVDGGLPRRRRHAAPVLAQHVPHPEALPARAVAARRQDASATAPRST